LKLFCGPPDKRTRTGEGVFVKILHGVGQINVLFVRKSIWPPEKPNGFVG